MHRYISCLPSRHRTSGSFAAVSARFFLLTCCLLGSVGQTQAAPTTPVNDATVLERLPFKANDPVARELAELRKTVQRNPNDQANAAKLARRYYELVAEEGDPRYLGYAEAALAPWWKLAAPPDEVLLMRASLKQFRHDFAGAIQDLDHLLERVPGHGNARALRATLHIVQARYPAARSDCQALQGPDNALIALGCLAMVDGLTGHAAEAYARLDAAFKAEPQAVTRGNRLWILLRLAEMAQRLSNPRAAEAHFKQALALGQQDTLLLAAWSDFLLDQQRTPEILALLQDKTRSDNLLLRLVLAEPGVNTPAAQQHRATLAARYGAAQLRGDTVHQQEEARFALRIENNPAKALRLAQENWKVQLEPHDARIFLEAALALRDATAAQPVLQWLAESKHEDRYLLQLASQLRKIAPSAKAEARP
ncbi:MAG: hypothetical protein EXR37_09245 [Limnohabitans sp.]|nr:hypothetical protein [Limnohabitans sp.]